MRILEVSREAQLRQILRRIKVDPYGIKIMTPKGITYLVILDSVASVTANILKQEMLSLGADAAVARGALTGRNKVTDCLLMGNLAQFSRLKDKLKKQPFGLDKLGSELSQVLKNYQRDKFTIDLARYRLHLGRRPYIMGIVNLTPDSFSNDGLYGKWQMADSKWHKDNITAHIQQMVDDGADIIDVGGESTRPGAKAVSLKEELARTIPIIKMLTKKIKVPVSIDTYKPEVARQALDNGAVMVNDISGLRNPTMAKIVARHKAAVVIMHMKGNPRSMQQHPLYESLIDEIIEYLNKVMQEAIQIGVKREKIILDPGIGFGKTLAHNLEILKRLGEFKVLGRPIMVGTSRKSFLGKILKLGPQERTFGTVASCVLALKNGARLLRVHDVNAVKQAIKVFSAIDNYN